MSWIISQRFVCELVFLKVENVAVIVTHFYLTNILPFLVIFVFVWVRYCFTAKNPNAYKIELTRYRAYKIEFTR